MLFLTTFLQLQQYLLFPGIEGEMKYRHRVESGDGSDEDDGTAAPLTQVRHNRPGDGVIKLFLSGIIGPWQAFPAFSNVYQ
jgi:hypothetical protein